MAGGLPADTTRHTEGVKVAVAGGTGVVGSYAVHAMGIAGWDVSVLSRSNGVDVVSGEGLAAALEGVEVIVDTLNSPSIRRAEATDFFRTTTRNLHHVGAAAGVQHLVTLSIVGIDRVPGYPYYAAKLAQEQEAESGPIPGTILRATQFHEFPAQVMRTTRKGRWAAVPRMTAQPVAARTVGQHLTRMVSQRPGEIVELAGPAVEDMVEMARRLIRASGKRVHVMPLSLPGAAAKAMRGEALLVTPSPKSVVDGPTFDEWLESDDAKAVPF
jgi:uncharacterized protein YbjT (DUF2867 family)